MDWREAENAYQDPVLGRTTLARMFERSAARNVDRIAQRYKGGIYERSLVERGVVDPAPDGEFADLTYGEVRGIVRTLAAGFRALGLRAGDRVGLFSHTRMEWAQVDFAVLAAGGVVSTVYASASERQVTHLLSDPGASGVVVENAALLDRVLAVEDDLDLSYVVVVDRLPDDLDREDVYSLADVYDRGADAYDHDAYQSWLGSRRPEDLASLIYTSGTTGRPKGVRLTHLNFRSNVNQCYRRFGPRPDKGDRPVIDPETTALSYLPLAHVFERLAGHFLMFAAGATVAYAESPDTLREDFLLVRPTTGTSVPRVYEKLYDAIREEASASDVRRRIFEWAVAVGRRYQEVDDPGAGLRLRHRLADRLVFSRVREALGGRVDFFISGGGSLSKELCALYHAMGLPVLEGYGLTETSPVVCVNPIEEPKVGTIGPPVRGVEVAIDESVGGSVAGEAGGAVGELLVRGPNVAGGYWRLPEETAASFLEDLPDEVTVFGEAVPETTGGDGAAGERPDDGVAASAGSGRERSAGDGGDRDAPADGDGGDRDAAADGEGAPVGSAWFRTGDVVERRPDGYLAFRERAKQLLVLSTGKNVAPGPIEDAFAASDVVEQCMVLGDGRKFVSALVVPNVDVVRAWAARGGVDLPDSERELCRDERVRDLIGAEIDRVNREFEPHERIKQFRLIPDEFTVEDDLVTPTMKKKRRNILERYADEIRMIYDD
ncbi:MAG: long-chain fatty acid--CoA ligase [Salinigranum sp.]